VTRQHGSARACARAAARRVALARVGGRLVATAEACTHVLQRFYSRGHTWSGACFGARCTGPLGLFEAPRKTTAEQRKNR
jgi:hypothetical protein